MNQEQLDTPCEFVRRRPFRPIIYGLVDPLEPKHVRYVGMASNAGRPYVHAKQARRPNHKYSHLRHWVQKLQAEGREYTVLILEELSEDVSRHFLGEVEKMYIASLRAIGHNLTNATDGGEGALNPSQEVRAALSARNKGNKYGLGKKKSERTRKQIGESRKKYFEEHPEACEEISKRNIGNTFGLGHKHTEDTKKQIGDAKRGKSISITFTEEDLQRRADRFRQYNLSPEAAADREKAKPKRIESLHRYRNDPSNKEALDAAQINRTAGIQAARAQMSASQKAAWERKKAEGYVVSAETIAKRTAGIRAASAARKAAEALLTPQEKLERQIAKQEARLAKLRAEGD